MSDHPPKKTMQEILVQQQFSHPVDVIWKALTTKELLARWLMEPLGFLPEKGTLFFFQTEPAGAWDGRIRCEVTEVIQNELLVYTWKSGHEKNAGYGSQLNTKVTFKLTKVSNGTLLSLHHSGFEIPKNDTAFANLDRGWRTAIPSLEDIASNTSVA